MLGLRAGYQFLWIDGVHLAEDAFLGTGVDIPHAALPRLARGRGVPAVIAT